MVRNCVMEKLSTFINCQIDIMYAERNAPHRYYKNYYIINLARRNRRANFYYELKRLFLQL